MSPSAASSSSSYSSSVSGSEMESTTRNLKRKKKISESRSEEDSDADSDASDSDLEEDIMPRTTGVKQDGLSKSTSTEMRTVRLGEEDEGADLDGPTHDENHDENEDDIRAEKEEEEAKVLSHREQRRLKKKQQKTSTVDSTAATAASSQPASAPAQSSAQIQTQLKPTGKRQNSVWVGNLSFRITPEALRAFFTDAGAREVTRVHMPTKGVPGLDKMKLKGVKSVKENRGFAYVDFSTPEAKALAISFSERNLDGRRLLIKDGDDFTGRPDPPTAPAGTPGIENELVSSYSRDNNENNENNENATDKGGTKVLSVSGFQLGPTKTAKKILRAQKQPPCPCLFLGNLGFEATEERIRQMFEGHAKALALMRFKKVKNKERKVKKGRKRKRGDDDDDLLGVEEREEAGDEEHEDDKTRLEEEEEQAVEVDLGIKKVRMGTFEDSGVCKGFAFVDFMTTSHATAALTNPRNHFLDGRALVVEYASPEAARRGGHGRASRHSGSGSGPDVEAGERKRKIPKRSGENKYNDWKKKKKAGSGPHIDGEEGGEALQENNGDGAKPRAKRPRTEWAETNADADTDADADADADGRAATTKETSKVKARENKKERRQKPGAALAQAQREKYAIVPSEGTRLKFS